MDLRSLLHSEIDPNVVEVTIAEFVLSLERNANVDALRDPLELLWSFGRIKSIPTLVGLDH